MSRMSRVLPMLLLSAAAACAQGGRRPAGAAERLGRVETAAVALRVSDGGVAGLPVVFVHGLGGDLEAWRPQLDHLRRAGQRAIAYDQRGHGESQPVAGAAYDLAALSADLDAVIRGLALERVVLVGHSLGGLVITAYAGAHPGRVAGLVYADAVGDLSAVPRAELSAWLESQPRETATVEQRRALFGELLGAARPGTREQVLASLDRMDGRAFVALRRELASFSAREPFSRWRGPAIAIEAAAERPDATLASQVLGVPRETLHGVSHWLQLDDPDGFNRLLDRALEAIEVVEDPSREAR